MPTVFYDFRKLEDPVRIEAYADFLKNNAKVFKQIFGKYGADRDFTRLGAKQTFDGYKESQNLMTVQGLSKMVIDCNLSKNHKNVKQLKDDLTILVK